MSYTPKLKCTECGDEKGCSKDRWEKLLIKHGTEKQLRDSYKSRSCRKGSQPAGAARARVQKPDQPKDFLNKCAFQSAFNNGDFDRFDSMVNNFLFDYCRHKQGAFA